MAEIPSGIQVTDQAVIVNGISKPLDHILAAEASHVEDWGRMGVLLLVGLLAPIGVMYFATLAIGTEFLGNAFGPFTLVGSVLCGLAACAIGVAWKKPWGVIVERQEFGHARLLRCANQAEAENLAQAINGVIARRG